MAKDHADYVGNCTRKDTIELMGECIIMLTNEDIIDIIIAEAEQDEMFKDLLEGALGELDG